MRYLFQGDSITDAFRLDNADATSTGMGYVRLLESRLTCEDPQAQVLNGGISGHRVSDLLARWKKDCLNLEPDVLTVLVGINDIIHEYFNQNGVGADLYETLYRMLLQQITNQNPNVKLVLMSPFLVGDGSADPVWGKNWNEIKADLVCFQQIVRRLAEEFGAIHIDLQDIFDKAQEKAPAKHWSFDSVHPTAAGHELIARSWTEAVMK